MRVAWLLLASWFVACASVRGVEAQRLLEAGQADDALALWTKRLAEAPNDDEAARGQRQVLGVLAQQACMRASTGAVAPLVEVNRLLARGAPPPRQLETARAKVAAKVAAHVRGPLGLGQPLTARRVLAGLPLDEAGLGELKRTLDGEVRSVGTRRCAVFTSLARSPYLATAVTRYCSQFGAQGPVVVARPEPRGALRLDVSGVPGVETSVAMLDAASRAFEHTPWFDPHGEGAVEGRAAGRLESALESSPMTVTASWVELESYVTTEQQTETYQESYMENEYVTETSTETYTATEQRPVTVSYTEYESYTYTCGSYPSQSTCMGSRPVTRWRTEYRSETVVKTRPVSRQVMRQVTKYRPATRQVTRTVTKTRPVSHSVQYPAVQKRAHHRASLVVALALPGTSKALELPYTGVLDQDDVEHETTNAAAGLAPHKAAVSSGVEWSAQVARAVGVALEQRLHAAWLEAFCEDVETPERALRCLASPQAPTKAWAAVARFFGEGEEEMQALLR